MLLKIIQVLGLVTRLLFRLYFFIGSLLLLVLAFAVFWITHANDKFHATDWVIFGIVAGLYFLALLDKVVSEID